MFLLPSINMKLRPIILNMRPGTRIVSNSFNMEDWEPDAVETITKDCSSWCTALLWIVPAKVDGAWHLGTDQLTLHQQFQKVSGTLGAQIITEGRLRGEEIVFNVGPVKYTGRVNGGAITGTTTAGSGATFAATRSSTGRE
jgi:hypothetical protein